uniref:cDNA FLJ53699, moderately similar to 4F2 cell-surface antigen heavy chain n=1 Tax=Homo sapiens TaxID=9606 RepID=B4E3E4_HUMAN|nr:unnamed protein product [Homo sapiens]
MSQDTEVDMKEVELNELEPEKQPMNAASGAAMSLAGAEKNGLVKIKVAEDEAEAAAAAKFTGLSKEELLKVAGSPGWVRTRWCRGHNRASAALSRATGAEVVAHGRPLPHRRPSGLPGPRRGQPGGSEGASRLPELSEGEGPCAGSNSQEPEG